MDFWTAVGTCFRKYATFQGRARRSEFWYFWLFLLLGSIAAAILDQALGTTFTEEGDSGGALQSLFNLATLLPALAVAARRLHDTNHSGWWQVAYVVPAFLFILGAVSGELILLTIAGIALVATLIMLLIWLVRAGDQGPNRFGEDPLGPAVMAQPYGTGGGNWPT